MINFISILIEKIPEAFTGIFSGAFSTIVSLFKGKEKQENHISDSVIAENNKIGSRNIKGCNNNKIGGKIKGNNNNIGNTNNTTNIYNIPYDLLNKTNVAQEVNDYTEYCSMLLTKPNEIFYEHYEKELIKKRNFLFGYKNTDLNNELELFSEKVHNIRSDYEKAYKERYWNVRERIYMYQKDGLIDSGEDMNELEFYTEERIADEQEKYKEKNIMDTDVVNNHIIKVYKLIN